MGRDQKITSLGAQRKQRKNEKWMKFAEFDLNRWKVYTDNTRAVCWHMHKSTVNIFFDMTMGNVYFPPPQVCVSKN